MGLYGGAIAVQLNELLQRSKLRENPETITDANLGKIRDHVEQMTGLQVWVDEQPLTDAGIDLDSSHKIPEWPQGETISQFTRRLSDASGAPLTWVVDGRLITLTTLESANEKYVTRQYPVGPLLRRIGDYSPLFTALETATPGPWEGDEPGTGTLSLVRGVLAVRQTHRSQQEVAELLAGLERSEPIVLLGSSSRDLELRRMVETQIVNFDWSDVPLNDFCHHLEQLTGARYALDVPALNDAGLDADSRLNARAIDLPLHVALKQHLSDVNGTELTYRISDDQIQITTAEKANEQYETVIYNVRDFGISTPHLEACISAIENETTGPWDSDEPGTGTICAIEPLGVLVIRQTQRQHREVLEYLREIQRLRSPQQKAASQPLGDGETQLESLPRSITESGSSPFRQLLASLKRTLCSSEGDGDFEFSLPLLLALALGAVVGFLGRNSGTQL